MKVIIYCRTSTELQEAKGTISMQFDQLARWAEANGAEIVQTYQDEDASGTLMLDERPGGKQLLADLPRHKAAGVALVAFYEWSRLARDPGVFWGAVVSIERRGGIRLKSITEREDTSDPDGVLLLCIRNGINYTERIRTVRRSIDATEMLAREGVWLGGIAPFGYRVEGKDRTARIVPATDPIPGFEMSEVDVVKLVYQWCVEEHLSTIQIADRLNARGIPPTYSRPGATNKRKRHLSGQWTNARVRNLLVMETYQGTHKWGKRQIGAGLRKAGLIERAVPALVEPATWERAQQVLRENALWADRNVKRDYLLRGLIRCGVCGSSYVGGAAKDGNGEFTYLYYSCAGRQRHRHNCRNRTLPARIEELVWDDIAALLAEPEEALRKLKAKGRKPNGAENELRLIARQRGQVNRQRDRVLEMMRRETLDFDTADAQLRALREEDLRYAAREAELAAEAQAEAARATRAETVTESIRLVRDYLANRTEPTTRRAVVETLVVGLVVTPIPDTTCAEVLATYRFPARAGPITSACEPHGCPREDQTDVIRHHRCCGKGRGVRWEA